MTNRINPATFDRMLAERALTVSEFSKHSGVSRDTIARIRRGDEVSMKTIEKIAGTLQNTAPRPYIAELLAS
jgi:predicted transcriptional regulator